MVRIWNRHLCVSCAVALAGVLWAGCRGDPYVDVEAPPPCDSTTECDPERTRTECIDGRCLCPDPEEKTCCRPGAKEENGDICERACRPISECDATP
ncbi:uncharacterized protein SOCE26_065450 [Sorangium cellulosum]|uniref:Secreted protein n=1 Tax=Sorangium cellulosum TaxID=56 RepID=A0A2L0F0I1_SORCE|nr:uncharacterized protein SOCE26_065450 [Sorangium cellulosum]